MEAKNSGAIYLKPRLHLKKKGLWKARKIVAAKNRYKNGLYAADNLKYLNYCRIASFRRRDKSPIAIFVIVKRADEFSAAGIRRRRNFPQRFCFRV